jgi:hypothetical protein
MSFIAAYRDVYQVGYVTADLDRAIAFLGEKKMGVAAFTLREPDLTVQIKGEQHPLRMRVAVANIGRMQFEVIQPVSGAVEIYTQGIDYGRSVLAFHHVGIAVSGPIAAWDDMVREVRSNGDDLALSFAFDAGPEAQVRFAYVDTRAYLGHYTEYLWWKQGFAAANAALPNLAA